jgi:hypothetical protein
MILLSHLGSPPKIRGGRGVMNKQPKEAEKHL